MYSVRINATPPLMSLRRCPPPAPRMHHHTHTRTKALACMSHALCSCDKCCVLKVPSQLHIRKQRMSITNDASAWASGLMEAHHTALVMFMHGDAWSFMRRVFLPLFRAFIVHAVWRALALFSSHVCARWRCIFYASDILASFRAPLRVVNVSICAIF